MCVCVRLQCKYCAGVLCCYMLYTAQCTLNSLYIYIYKYIYIYLKIYIYIYKYFCYWSEDVPGAQKRLLPQRNSFTDLYIYIYIYMYIYIYSIYIYSIYIYI